MPGIFAVQINVATPGGGLADEKAVSGNCLRGVGLSWRR